jgi:hypothetical protein
VILCLKTEAELASETSGFVRKLCKGQSQKEKIVPMGYLVCIGVSHIKIGQTGTSYGIFEEENELFFMK